MITTREELISELQKSTKETPYVIEPSKTGFVLTLNIIDKKWYTILQKNGINQSFMITAEVDEVSHSVSTTDELRTLEWSAGIPRIGAKRTSMKGEIYQFGTRKELGISESGKVGVVVDYSFSTAEVKKWLDTELKRHGWKRKWGTEAKIGLVVGLIAAVGSIITVIVLIIVALNGGFNN